MSRSRFKTCERTLTGGCAKGSFFDSSAVFSHALGYRHPHNEMVDFTVVSRDLNRFKPLDLARRAIALHQQENPNMPAVLLTDNKTGIDYSMMFFPTALRKDGQFSEISFFKYYKDSATGQTIIFHFARNIPKPNTPSESAMATGREIRLSRCTARDAVKRTALIDSQAAVASKGCMNIWIGRVDQEERYGGNPTSHTPAHNVPAVAAAFRL